MLPHLLLATALISKPRKLPQRNTLGLLRRIGNQHLPRRNQPRPFIPGLARIADYRVRREAFVGELVEELPKRVDVAFADLLD